MERKIVILRTVQTPDSTNVLTDFQQKLLREVSEVMELVADQGGGGDRVVSVRDVTCCVPPSTSWSSSPLTSQPPYNLSRPSLLSLAESLHVLMDSLPPPGTFVLSLLWLCDSPPVTADPQLYGALQRAVSWHSAHLTIICQEELDPHHQSWPWLQALRAEILPASYLCSCHGLQEFITPSIVWRGSLTFYQAKTLTSISLPGYELHLHQDELTLQSRKLMKTNKSQSRPLVRFFSGQLEVVTTVSLSEVLSRPQLLTGQKYVLKTSILESDDCSNQFMTNTDTAFIVKLKFSYDKPKIDGNVLKTDNWKQSIINCDFSRGPPCQVMASNVDTVNFLVYEEPGLEADCSRNAAQKTCIVLESDLNEMYCLKQSLRQQMAESEGYEAAVSGIKFCHLDDWKLIQVRQYVRKVQSHVLGALQERESDILENNDISDILESIQSKILADIGLTPTYRDISSEELEDITAKASLGKNWNEGDPEESQEKNFLRYLASCKEKQEQEEHAQSKLLKPNDEDYVILEAKELLKYFDSNGVPSKPLNQFNVKNKNFNLKPQKSTEEYNFMMSENFDLVPSEEFNFKGYKFREGQDFSAVEFTQYHDVYYNTGVSSETYDTQCKNYRDCMVGPHRETRTTFSSGDAPSTRLKVPSKKSEPEKKTQKKSPASDNIKEVGGRSRRSQEGGKLEPAGRRSQEGGRRSQEGSRLEPAGRRKSAGETGELTEVYTKKLRIAIYDVLMENNIDQKNPLFKKCFPKLFNICKMYVLEGPDE